MTQNKIFVIHTGHLYFKSLAVIEKIIALDYPVYVLVYEKPSRIDIYGKIINILKTKYSKKINKTLYIDTYDQVKLDLKKIIASNQKLVKYDEYIILDSDNHYYGDFFSKVINNQDNIDHKKFVPLQQIDRNYAISSNNKIFINSWSKKFIRPEKTDKIISKEYPINDCLVSSSTESQVYSINQPQFRLHYLEEQEKSPRMNSYCFFYEDNKKCMNIQNNTVGVYEIIDHNNIKIHWENEEGYLVYCLKENDNVYLCKQRNTY